MRQHVLFPMIPASKSGDREKYTKSYQMLKKSVWVPPQLSPASQHRTPVPPCLLNAEDCSEIKSWFEWEGQALAGKRFIGNTIWIYSRKHLIFSVNNDFLSLSLLLQSDWNLKVQPDFVRPSSHRSQERSSAGLRGHSSTDNSTRT